MFLVPLVVFLGVKFGFRKSCQCKRNDKYEVCSFSISPSEQVNSSREQTVSKLWKEACPPVPQRSLKRTRILAFELYSRSRVQYQNWAIWSNDKAADKVILLVHLPGDHSSAHLINRAESSPVVCSSSSDQSPKSCILIVPGSYENVCQNLPLKRNISQSC